MTAYKRRILRVDLTNHKFYEEPLSDELIHNYIGGRGFGIRMLYDELKPGVDALGPDNKIIFLTGPLAGTGFQSFSRIKVFFKSPLTGTCFRTAAGGSFAPELKFAGFDGVIIEGTSDKPVYLWIHQGRYEFRDATYLQGLDCVDTHTLIREELHDPLIRIACIGPAGDNKVKYACIMTDRRAAGRGGGGAVMGAKNLKAIAVRGHEKVTVADTEAFRMVLKKQIDIYRGSSQFESFSKQGTQFPEFTNILGMFPTRNFREGVLQGWEKIEAINYDSLRVRDTSCHKCMIHCGNLCKVNSGKYKGWWSEGPEYETAWVFTGPIACTNIGLTVAGDRVCDDLGLDTISAGSSIGFAYELYEKGFLTKKDLDGMELIYGDTDPVLPLLRKIAYREGIGDVLAEGVREAAHRIGKGTDYFAIHVKGLELPGYDPRGAKAHGLNMMTTSIGADHNSGYSGEELFSTPYRGQKINRFTVEGKAEITKHHQDFMAIRDSGIQCGFAGLFMREIQIFSELLSTATGIRDFTDTHYLWLVGERINNLERMFNVREGFGRQDDCMPKRITNETLPDGPSAGSVFEAEELLNDYYQVRGWDIETGIPTETKLRELGLDFTL